MTFSFPNIFPFAFKSRIKKKIALKMSLSENDLFVLEQS